jgi:putrescine aminotransferase
MVPGFVQIEPPYCYRCPYQEEAYPQCGLACAHALEKAILAEGPESVAAFILEPVMGEFGVVAPPADYYGRVGETCRQYGVLFIADEVTTGFGRTGKLFASQDWNPQPDMLCLGKAISGGYLPVSATLTTEAIYQRFLGEKNWFMHGSTNSGHPVCAAVALAAIDIILREKLADNAARVGAHLKSRLSALMDGHPIIGEVRGPGLMVAIDLTKNRQTKEPFAAAEIYEFLLDAVGRGMLLSYSDWGLSLFPPLNIDETIADEIAGIMDGTLHTGTRAELERKARLLRALARSKI